MEPEKNTDLENGLDMSASYDDYLVWCLLQGIFKPLNESEFRQLLLDVKNDEFDTDRLHGLGFFLPLVEVVCVPDHQSI
jgi:hypothetical protein